MKNIIKLRTLEDLLLHALNVANGVNTWEESDYSELDLRIPVVVKGPNRDHKIDYRAGKFIQDIQFLVNNTYADFEFKEHKKAPRIQVETKGGSNWLLPDFTELAKEAITMLSPEQVLIFLLATVVGGTGYLAFAKWQDSKTQREMMHVFERMHHEAVGAGKDLSKPVRSYINTIEKSETIAVGNGQDYPKSVAKNMIKKPAIDDKTYYVWADGNFDLLGLELSQEIPALRIAQGGKTVTALLERLDVETKNNLLRKIDQRLGLKQVPFPIDLQVDVYFSGNRISHASIIALDTPRTERRTFPLVSIPGEIPDSELILPGFSES